MTYGDEESRQQCPKWFSINWKKVHYRVLKLQKRIAQAYLDCDYKRLRHLQMSVFSSYYCRLTAVHRVTSKKNRRTAGIDGKFWKTDTERFDAVHSLRDYHNYKPLPFKRMDVPKDHDKSKTRPLSVPAIYDRAMQGLILIAIDPVVECTGGKHDYGSRKYRSNQDAIKDVYCNFEFEGNCPYVLKSDISQCFDHVSHQWLIDHAPMKKTLLKKLLKCDYIYRGKKHTLTEGVPQGGVYSPVLVNLALNGFETVLEKKYGRNTVHMVRFVDDFLFSSHSEKILADVLETLKEWLKKRGMFLSEEKTKICKITEGIDFIGRRFIVENGKLWVCPNEQAIREKRTKLTNVVKQAQNWTARKLILKLNDGIRGWGQHYTYLCPSNYLTDMDDFLNDLLWEWAVTKHKGKKTRWIYRHYWIHNKTTNRREFASGDAKLMRFADQKTRLKQNFDLTKNPYLDLTYFRTRTKKTEAIREK